LLEATGGGILCEPNDAQDLAEGLDGLLADSARARALGAAGRAVVVERYGVDAVARRLAELYARPAAATGGKGS
jgi:glycosyltransferase involved in cell wall biosynthesis